MFHVIGEKIFFRLLQKIFCHCQMQRLVREWTIDTKIIKYNLLQPTACLQTVMTFVRLLSFSIFLLTSYSCLFSFPSIVVGT